MQYSLEMQKYGSIVPRSIEEAGKKFLTSYPLLLQPVCQPLSQFVFNTSPSVVDFL